MHMYKKMGADNKMDIAYWVVNYPTLAAALADGRDKPKPGLNPDYMIATVAMDYAWDTARKKRYTKFFVFDPTPTGNLRKDADLDGAGNKFTPNLCVTCHGTTQVNVTKLPRKPKEDRKFKLDPPDGDVGGRFIPFDLEGFTYAKETGVATAQFRELNRGIYLYTPMTPAMQTLIEGWYGGALNDANANAFTINFIPAGWAGEAALYKDAVRISCRGCHVMRKDSIGFGSFKDFQAEIQESIVCKSLLMPNAQRTFSIFWGSMAANAVVPPSNPAVPNQPDMLAKKFKWGPCPAKPIN